MRKVLVGIVLAVMAPCLCLAGMYSDYDDSKLEKFKGIIASYEKAPLDGKLQFLKDARSLNDEIRKNCMKAIGRVYAHQCYTAFDYTCNTLGKTYIDYAKKLIEAGRTEEAKTFLQEFKTNFTADVYKSYLKEADLMLDRLAKQSAETNKPEKK